MAQHDCKNYRFCCTICSAKFGESVRDQRIYTHHFSVQHSRRKTCKSCLKSFASSYDFMQHFLQEKCRSLFELSFEKKYGCQVCLKLFHSLKSARQHYDETHQHKEIEICYEKVQLPEFGSLKKLKNGEKSLVAVIQLMFKLESFLFNR